MSHAIKRYSLITKNDCGKQYVRCTEGSLRDLFRLDHLEAEDLARPLSLDELDSARTNRPAWTAWTVNYFKLFGFVLKHDFLSVLNRSFLTGWLPLTFRRAVINLLPKKKDLADLANWRPVSLLNNDYKILAKLLANRLKECIGGVVCEDQTYCVPGRSIHDNVSLIRDVIDYSNENDLPLAVVGLDEKKGFDNVDHDYLFDTLGAMGFGNRFLDYIKVLYCGSENLVKICGSLTAPFSFENGIRQGCPLSGLIYSIAIEPFLNRLRSELGDDGFRVHGASAPCSASAYADDVSVFVTSDSGFGAVERTYNLFARASAARLNTKQKQGIFVGSWIGRSDRLLNFSWNSEGLPFLGVYLGNKKSYTDKNWEVCKTRLIQTLASWSGLSTSLSFKGRVLIANQLAASKLFHCLAALTPPDSVLSELQQQLVDFVWSNKKHFLTKQYLYEKPGKGGLGLVCLQARVLTFRLSRLFHYFQENSHPSLTFFEHHLHRYKHLHFYFYLFFIKTDLTFDIGMPSFYGEIMQTWRLSGARLQIKHDSVSHVLNLPIIYFLIQNATDESALLSSRLSARGVGLVGDLLHSTTGTWREANDFFLSSSTSRHLSLRLLEKQLSFMHSILLGLFPSLFDERGFRQPVRTIQDLNSKPDRPLNVIISNMDNVISAPSKLLYTIINSNINSSSTSTSSPWHINGFLDSLTRIQWKSIYSPPTSKKERDTQYKLLHNVLVFLQVLHHLNPAVSSLCGWCGDEGTIWHLFITCPSVQPLLNCIYCLLHRLLLDLKLNFDLYWALIPCARSRKREAVRLANFLIVSCKNFIYHLYRTSRSVNPHLQILIFIHRTKCKIIFEYNYFKLVCNDDEFLKKWAVN